ncbi:GbsR/MarR family transcriptional regulator [Thermococcus sp.]|uniref:GbsR/MarR family transcriptional regulator n=1 Tax=Thermococcus sp. TaxID=35749 RepID=UPI00260B9148|nr:helix-turn-helix domain-containing protein [Thermococcus sp.]
MDARAETAFVAAVEHILSRWGYTLSEGRVYAVLLLNKEPMSISAIKDATGLSRSTVSTALSKLSRDYLVVARVEGRNKLFSALPGFFNIFMRQPREMLEREVRPAIRLLKDSGANGEVLEEFKRLECALEEILLMGSDVTCKSPRSKGKT